MIYLSGELKDVLFSSCFYKWFNGWIFILLASLSHLQLIYKTLIFIESRRNAYKVL